MFSDGVPVEAYGVSHGSPDDRRRAAGIQPPFAYVMVQGTAKISEDLDDLLAWATKIGGRYMGADRAEEFGRRNGVEGELLVRLTPTKTATFVGVSD